MRKWIGRRHQFGLYDQLMVELRNEDQQTFKNFLCMVPDMYDELLKRVGPNITKQHTPFRAPTEFKVCTDFTPSRLIQQFFHHIQYWWRVQVSTQSIIVREVCQAILDEYLPEVMNCPTAPEE